MSTKPIYEGGLPDNCNACGKPVLLSNLFVDDGCPCNSPRGVNFKPRPCALCRHDYCVKPGHHIEALFGIAAPAQPCLACHAPEDRADEVCADARRPRGRPKS
jgi:hypothetical protein